MDRFEIFLAVVIIGSPIAFIGLLLGALGASGVVIPLPMVLGISAMMVAVAAITAYQVKKSF